MATLPPKTILPPDHAAHPGAVTTKAPEATVRIEEAWAALHAQAACLALHARISAEPVQNSSAFGVLVGSARPWQRTFVAQGIDDTSAMLTSGLAALATLSARGQDAAAPALALWREFHAARTAMLAVLEPGRDS